MSMLAVCTESQYASGIQVNIAGFGRNEFEARTNAGSNSFKDGYCENGYLLELTVQAEAFYDAHLVMNNHQKFEVKNGKVELMSNSVRCFLNNHKDEDFYDADELKKWEFFFNEIEAAYC